MSSTQVGSDAATQAVEPATIPLRFEVTTLPVTDVDRAKAFYQRLGWRLDIKGRLLGVAGKRVLGELAKKVKAIEARNGGARTAEVAQAPRGDARRAPSPTRR